MRVERHYPPPPPRHHDADMPDPHCSKCCPIKPPDPPEPWVPHPGIYLWLVGLAAAIVGGWWAIVWTGSRLFG